MVIVMSDLKRYYDLVVRRYPLELKCGHLLELFCMKINQTAGVHERG